MDIVRPINFESGELPAGPHLAGAMLESYLRHPGVAAHHNNPARMQSLMARIAERCGVEVEQIPGAEAYLLPSPPQLRLVD